jgi:hypothetical protein
MNKHELKRHVEVAQQLLRALDCPRALSVSIMLKYEMWDEIANLQLDPLAFNTSHQFFLAHQATKLLSKAKWLPTSIDKRLVAKEKFEEAEDLCSLTNQFWKPYREMKLNLLPRFERVIHSARRKIGLVLGSDLYKWTEYCDFGPGADCSTVSGMTSVYNKLSKPGGVTIGAHSLLNNFCALTRLGCHFVSDPKTGLLDIDIRRGNTVTFVPKNAKTDRPIAVEPRWNMFMQKGFGSFLRKRLKQFGVDLNHQGTNQAFAIYGSHTAKYATIDLASASDTVSKEVVLALLPEPWTDILAALRSPAYHLDGEWRSYEKWSSMGNGYTFELESLLFWSLCSSISEDVSVYGDDLIVPTESFESIVEILELCGFKVNPSKSYAKGYFRESCGQDAFNGDSVTPIYWKEHLDDQGTLSLVNQISVLSRRLGFGYYRNSKFKKVWKELVFQLPKRFQQRGPSSISTVVHDEETKWALCRKSGWDGFFINVHVPIPRRFRYYDIDVAISAHLLRRPWGPSSDAMISRIPLREYAKLFSEPPSLGSHGYSVRDNVVWKKRTIFIPSGYVDVGPWSP